MGTKSYYYTGDVSLEYGGAFVCLDDWEHGYCDAVRVTDLESACGFRGACLIEHVTILGTDEPDRIRRAMASGGLRSLRGATKEGARLTIADALLNYGHYDPAQPDHWFDSSPKSEIVQMEADGPMEFGGWKADKRLHNTELRPYVESVHLDGPVVPLPHKPVKADRWDGTPYRNAWESFEEGDWTGLLVLADYFEDRGERPELVALIREAAGRDDREDVAWFYKYGGCSYDPATETEEQGFLRQAIGLADAESWFHSLGDNARCVWEVDAEADRSWLDGEGGPEGGDDDRPLYQCTVSVLADDGSEIDFESCGGIDLGLDHGVPWGEFGAPKEPYTRVVRAELAAELQGRAIELDL